MKHARTLGIILVACFTSCTQERLEIPKKETRNAVDNLVSIEADFCTQEPDEEAFPVKILLVMDASGSLQFLDEGGVRVAAVRALLNRYDGDNTVTFSIVQFNSLLYQFPADGTFGNPVDITDTQLQLAEVQTDYQAALSRAYQTLLRDMTSNEIAARNTKYVVVFFSDGQPGPVCCPCAEETAGPDSTQRFTCNANGEPDPPAPFVDLAGLIFEERYCEGQSELPMCNADANLTGRFEDAYGDLDINGSYNRGYQIDQLMRDIVDLATTFEVGAFQFHTVLLYNPNLPQAVRDIVQVDYDTASARMRSMAQIGGGTYVEARTAEDLDFLQFDYTAIKRAFGLRRAFVVNLSAVPGFDGPLADSDGDGISDDEENDLSQDILDSDTDDDGYGDLIEARLRDRGLDALDPIVPYQPCDALDRDDDADLDLLNRCEELLLGLDPEDPDSDHDTIPDGLELRFGLRPLEHDVDLDYDFDGVANGEEVNRHTDPLNDDVRARDHDSYRYTLTDNGETLDGRHCFGMSARNIQLTATQGTDGTQDPGWNDIRLMELESTEDRSDTQTLLRVACFNARYLPPDYKEPVDGRYRRLRDSEVRPVFDPRDEWDEPYEKCWGPPR